MQAPVNRPTNHFGEGYYVCAQCMEAEFPNNLEGQRMLEDHLETQHPQRAALNEAAVNHNDDDDDNVTSDTRTNRSSHNDNHGDM